jgi:hypothetical protein|eukprot:SAG25_NODE_733_length_5663_cov_27.142523_10_plen_73_part_00
MPLEAWQPGRTVVAGCVRVRWVRRSRTQSSDVSDRDFLRMATVLAVLDEAESFFISDIRQGLRILLFLCGNS